MITISRFTTSGLALLSLSSGAFAQSAIPRAYLAPDLVIESKQIRAAGSNSIGNLSVAPDGRMVLIPKNVFGEINAFDAQGKSLNWHVPVGGGSSEIGWVSHSGWVGNDFWIADPRYQQIVLIGANGKIVKSIEYPSWLHPRWAERRKYPLFAYMDALAFYPDSGMLALAMRSRTVIDTPDYDRSRAHLLRIDAGGAIQRTVATYPPDEGRGVTFKGEGNSEHTMTVPFIARSWQLISANGRRVAVVTPGATDADSGTYRVTMLNENGDTVYNRRYPQPVMRVSKPAVDSFLAHARGIYNIPVEQVRAKLAKNIPAFRSFLTDAFLGSDNSLWVVQRPVPDSARVRDALILDERGEPVATVRIPDGITPMIVDRTHLWGAERGKNSLVRFKVQATPPPVVAPTPAPPPRTAKASAAKAPSRR
jgi:hypothetical protein